VEIKCFVLICVVVVVVLACHEDGIDYDLCVECVADGRGCKAGLYNVCFYLQFIILSLSLSLSLSPNRTLSIFAIA
jgi:hypothetical protein